MSMPQSASSCRVEGGSLISTLEALEPVTLLRRPHTRVLGDRRGALGRPPAGADWAHTWP